jgi:hypothetical protein
MYRKKKTQTKRASGGQDKDRFFDEIGKFALNNLKE